MSRSYSWEKIFHNFAGFVGESDVNLAMLSGLIRRLKCCGEAALKAYSLQDLGVINKPPDLEIPDPEGEIKTPRRFYELLEFAIECVGSISSERDHLNHWVVALLDELDNTGDQLIKNWNGLPESSGRSCTRNASWVELFTCLRNRGPNSRSLKLKNFLELAIIRHGLFPYIEAKIKGKGVPQPQLQSLLLRATRCLEMEWRVVESTIAWFVYAHPEISELLLQEGADPNCRDAESNKAMASDEGRTAWTGLLQDGLEFIDYKRYTDRVPLWADTVKIFLKYGADPTVRWYIPHDKEDGHAMDIATPETVINAVLSKLTAAEEEDFYHLQETLAVLADVKELLSKAEANLGATEVTFPIGENVGQ